MTCKFGIYSFLARISKCIANYQTTPTWISAMLHKRMSIPKTPFGYQLVEGISNGIVTSATQVDDTVILDVKCIHAPGQPIGVFESRERTFLHLRRNKRYVFSDPQQLIGKRIELHTGKRYRHDGELRSPVIAVKVLRSPPLPATY